MSADTNLSGAKFSPFVPARCKSGARQGPRGAMQTSFLVSMAKSSFAGDSEDDVDVESEGEGNEGEQMDFKQMAEASMSGIIEKMVDASYRVAMITDEASKVLKSFIDGERKKSDEIISKKVKVKLEQLEQLEQDRSTPSPSLRIKLSAEIHEIVRGEAMALLHNTFEGIIPRLFDSLTQAVGPEQDPPQDPPTAEDFAREIQTKLKEIASGDSSGREGLPNRGILSSFLTLWDPTKKTMRALRENAEAHADTLVKTASVRMADHLWSLMESDIDLESGQSSHHFQEFTELCQSIERFLIADGLKKMSAQFLSSRVDSYSSNRSLKFARWYEQKMEEKMRTKNTTLQQYLGKGKIVSRATSRLLKGANEYTIQAEGFAKVYWMLCASLAADSVVMTKHISDLEYVKEQLKKLQELPTTSETWRDVVETWRSLLNLTGMVSADRALGVLQCMSSDEKLLSALGAGLALKKITGKEPPATLVSLINNDCGEMIRSNAFTYLKALDKEIAVIRRLIEYRDRAFAMVFSAVFSICTTLGVMIGNVLGRTYNDALKVPGSNLVWLLPLVVFAVVFSCVLLVSPLFYSSGAKRLLSKREKDQ